MSHKTRLLGLAAIALSASAASRSFAATSTSGYVTLGSDTILSSVGTLLSQQIEIQGTGSVTVFVHSDGRYGPYWGPAASAASIYITVDGVKVSNDSRADWRYCPNGTQHSFNAVGAVSLTAGAHTVQLIGDSIAGAYFVGAGTNLSVVVKPSTSASSQTVGADSGPYNFTSIGLFGTPTTLPAHSTLLSLPLNAGGSDVVVFGSTRAYPIDRQITHAGDAAVGLYLDGAAAGTSRATWSGNDLWTNEVDSSSEIEAPLYTHGFFPALSGSHTISLDATELPWSTPAVPPNTPEHDAENSVDFYLGGGSRLVGLWGGMSVRGSAHGTLDPNQSMYDYICVGTNTSLSANTLWNNGAGFPAGWPGCPIVGTPTELASANISIPAGHNGNVMFMGKTRVQADTTRDDAHGYIGDCYQSIGTAMLYLTIDGDAAGNTGRVGQIGVQQLLYPNGVSERTLAASYLATGSGALTPGSHTVRLFGVTGASDKFLHVSMTRDLPLVWFDGPGSGDAYTNSFELSSALSGWTTKATGCGGSGRGTATGPAPGGGQYSLSIGHPCSSGGVIVTSPKVKAYAGTTYRVDNMSRNGTHLGTTAITFYSGANPPAVLGGGSVKWSTDSNVYNADPQLVSLAPAGTASFDITYTLAGPPAIVEMDMLRVHTDP